jgi:holo-[acyl-carrier protein] synthase
VKIWSDTVIIGIGTDIIEISRIEKAISNRGFLTKYFTTAENGLFEHKKPQSVAGNFAAKEAVAKALATGFTVFSPIDIEVLRQPSGEPYVLLYGKAKLLADEKAIKTIHISISHCVEYAIAYVVAEG